MRIIIYYKNRGETLMKMFDVTIHWADISKYKSQHVGMSDEVIVTELAQDILKEKKGRRC